jgi:uncharacterized membrane protein YgaE (UPF0421/DUF939 family)
MTGGSRAAREVRERVRAGSAAGLKRLRQNGESIVQTAIAAAIAWFIAVNVVGHDRAYFAPTAAIMALGVAPGRRTKRTVQLVVGIGLGIFIGEVMVAATGTGPLQIAVLAAIVLVAAVFLDGTPLFVSQMAGSAVFVATLELTAPGSGPSRFLDALIGGVVGVSVLAIVNRDPIRAIDDASAPALGQLSTTLDAAANALAASDADRARRLQADAAALVPTLLDLSQVLDRAREAASLGRRTEAAVALARYRTAVPALPMIAGDVTGVARSVARAIELEGEVPDDLVWATRELAKAVRELRLYLRDGRGLENARATSAGAAERASRTIEGDAAMPIGALVGELRSTSADLLRATGLAGIQAVARVRESSDDRPGPVGGGARREGRELAENGGGGRAPQA